MALFPSLSELFSRPAPAAPLSAAQNVTAQNAAASNVTLTPGNGSGAGDNPTVPNDTTLKSTGSPAAFPETKGGEASPLDGFKKLWEATPILSDATTLVPTITADPAAMMKAAQGMDFTKAMNPELLAAASKGDVAALAGVINQAAQAGYAQAAIATVNITKAALTQQAETFQTKYAPQMLRDNASREAITATIPLSADPAAAPIVEALRRQLSSTYPTATAAEIATHTDNYLAAFSQKAVELAGGRVQTKADLASQLGNVHTRGDTDWSNFFGVDANS